MRKFLHTFALGTIIAAVSAPLAAQESLPDGRAVINRYIEAIGGRDAILNQGGHHVRGRFEAPAQGLTGDLEAYAKPPNLFWLRISIQGIVDILQGFDGTTGWTVNPMMGPMILDSLQLRQLKQQANLYSDLYPDSTIASLETVKDTTFTVMVDSTHTDVPCYKVKVTTTWGEEYSQFFAKDSGLQVGTIRTVASPMGDVESTTTLSDWREVDGVKTPFRTVQNTMGMVNRLIVTTAERVPVPDSIFALPPEIQALVKK